MFLQDKLTKGVWVIVRWPKRWPMCNKS